MARAIPVSELELISFCTDSVGKLFDWHGRLLRGIDPDAVSDTQTLFASGLIERLVDRGLLVKTWITDFEIEGCGLVVEHERIPVQTYPYEWSFSMLKDAALAVLEINGLAAEYGYQTKDAHGYNILFTDNRPVFVDLGSLQSVTGRKRNRGWLAYEEFIRFYSYPLRLWAQGNGTFARRSLLNAELVPTLEFIQYQSGLARLLWFPALKVLTFSHFKYKQISVFPETVITNRLSKTSLTRLIARTLLFLRKHGLLLFSSVNFSSLARRIRRMKNRRSATFWQGYHSGYFADGGQLKSTPRFDRVAEVVKELGAKSVFELGGNRGLLSCLLVQRAGVERVICSDYDENAIDQLYLFLKGQTLPITPVLMNSIFPMRSVLCKDTHERFRSDTVIALALTHHLLLTQGIPIEAIFRAMAQYATRHVLVEFMPLGLWDGKGTLPLPDWYTQDWFREQFGRHFDLLQEEQLEKNRVLFVGRIRD